MLTNVLVVIVALMLMSLPGMAQNGPTQHSATLNWTQSTSTGVTANCVYRGALAGTYTIPALFCSALPITTFKDTTVVQNTTYHYAVTAQAGTTESPFSNDVTAVIPKDVAAPTGLSTGLVASLDVPVLQEKKSLDAALPPTPMPVQMEGSLTVSTE